MSVKPPGSRTLNRDRVQATGDRSLRLRVAIRGAVQGVGFRPFIYRLATELRLVGWISNTAQGVFIEVEGAPQELEAFLKHLEAETPPRSFIQSLEPAFLDPVGYQTFEIRESDPAGEKTALVLPDIATCPACLREILDPNDRRYQYPFTNCTHCGPRFSILTALPYDRSQTTMAGFGMCAACRAEYDDPRDRRFHAQPNACPVCGPHLELWDRTGKLLASCHAALLQATDAVRQGAIVAVKGLGGFHLMVDAGNQAAVLRLRSLKNREEKPFALMAPSLEWVRACCEVSLPEERLLGSPESPIVLLRRRSSDPTSSTCGLVAPAVAPGNPFLGVMLPYTPLHHLLMAELGFPVVATSGNRADEPLCIDEQEALDRLAGIADLFLVHNRPIVRHVDDSIVRVVAGRPLLLRRARGYAPLPILLKEPVPPILAVGAHLKNTVAIATGRQVFVSQHIGDLETVAAFAAFRQVMDSFGQLYTFRPELIACDAHPDYRSTKFAEELHLERANLPVLRVQHHYAHVLACMAENDLDGPVLGVCWDGTGYSSDGTVWGGEFLRVNGAAWERRAHLRPFRLLGGDQAVREPRRAALGVLYEVLGESLFDRGEVSPVHTFAPQELTVLREMLSKGVRSPWTSSAGRLFDAVASLLDLCQRSRFEGQAAMRLEFALEGIETDERYGYEVRTSGGSEAALVVDWAPLIHEILDDLQRGVPVGVISARFHNTLVESIVAIAQCVGEACILLTGGCFQNQYLTERTVGRLQEAGFRPYWHQRVAPNDGGIALGQVVAAALTESER